MSIKGACCYARYKKNFSDWLKPSETCALHCFLLASDRSTIDEMEVEIAKLLNLNTTDKANLEDLIQDYLTEPSEESFSDNDSDQDSIDDDFDQRRTDFDRVVDSEIFRDTFVCCSEDEDIERVEWEKASKFSCTCKYFNNEACYRQFLPEEMIRRRMLFREMAPRDQMLVLLGKISCSINMSENTEATKRKTQKVRQHQRTLYWLEGNQICRDTFKFLHMLSQDRLTHLLKHYKENGLTPMEKKSGGRKSNTKSFGYQDACDVVQFLSNYASDHALVLPGRIPGYRRDDIKLLPSSHTKTLVYNQYKMILEKSGQRVMGSSSFFDFWKQLCSFIVVAKPMTDLCWTCQKNNMLIFRSANLTEENKSERVKLQEQHLNIVQQERSLYNAMISDAKNTCKQNGISQLSTNLPCSHNITMHYSFDFAQQVHLPSNPMQPGPLYFLVPRKVGIFGVCCEGIPKQVNFLVDEGHLISKGSNAVISYLDFYFDHYGIGETVANLHCDNCSGQNKNRFMIWYCAWRVAKRLHHSISLNFLIAGHTKFAPDWCFGLVKKSFRRHSVPALSVLQEVVNQSSSVNVAQAVGTEDGTTIVPVYDWQSFFADDCQQLPGIKSFQHFRFDCRHPGTVFAKSAPDSEEKLFYILKNNRQFPSGKATQMIPPGLTEQRQSYLYKHIRDFVTDPYKDTVCPSPSILTEE